MYNVQKRFEKISNNSPHFSSYTAFAETVRDTALNEITVRRWFYRLVDKDDYAKNEALAVLCYLVSIAKRDITKTAPGTT